MAATAALVDFATFLLSVLFTLAAVAVGSTAWAARRRRTTQRNDHDGSWVASARAVGEGERFADSCDDPLDCALASAVRLRNTLAERLGDPAAAVSWMSEIVRRLSPPEGPPRRSAMTPPRWTESVEAACLTRALKRVGERRESAGSPAERLRYSTTPLGILEDFVLPAIGSGRSGRRS